MQYRKEFEEICAEKFAPDSKIGVYGTVAPDGYPHLSLITSITVKSKNSLMWGQFSRGLSKEYVAQNPKTGFCVVSADQMWWSGKTLHRDVAIKGEDYEYFNNKPLFRYNSYCGIGAIHHEDLIEVSAGEKLPALAFAANFCKAGMMRGAAQKVPGTKLPPYGMSLCSKLMTLKFLAYIDADGHPVIFPALQGTAADANTLVFPSSPYSELFAQIPAGAKVAVFLANLDLESLLVQGRWSGIKKLGLFSGGIIEIDKVYNSMLPLPRYIYPPEEMPCVFGAAA